jgi:hypothetical protein
MNVPPPPAPNPILGGDPFANASVKVMRSYDYCHFEVALSMSNATAEQVDALRKTAARLADKAVQQYQIAKAQHSKRLYAQNELAAIEAEAEKIVLVPEKERTPEQLALLKTLSDLHYRSRALRLRGRLGRLRGRLGGGLIFHARFPCP